MSFVIGALVGIQLAQAQYEHEERLNNAFEESIRHFPYEERIRLQKEREARKEKYKLEQIEERRHRELCAAIRSTSFWRF